jgi:hypothetical protein
VPNVERRIIARIEQLEVAAREPERVARVRIEAQELIGSVRVIEWSYRLDRNWTYKPVGTPS